MDKNTNRPRNIRLPDNIWDATLSRDLRNSENICEECRGYGGYDYAKKSGYGLIKRCDRCGGRGYLDWVDIARGPNKEQFSYYTSHPGEGIAAMVEKENEEEYIQMIELELTGTFRFKSKDQI